MDTRDKVSDYAEDAADYVHGATDYVQKSTTKAAEALGEKGEQWLNAEQEFMKNCRAYVRDHPLKSVGIALAAGYVLTRLGSNR
ncbi:DUF883 C-terminal domain-containing protein [Methylobacter sp.]|uniref:DUF883 C-terminal domain-containing protein n=1 Tax=Methylobacter sp. TaxID=2051955 RepID=UPI0011FF4FD2|nr:DUF883 C-terminal domain-containing protein [Methylobacter sp.]TAK60591.1 MAG: hypothetical protein EPO18_16770 [Methylobacter sp.]